MKLEDEIKTTKFQNEVHKAHLNILFTAGWLHAKINKYLKESGLTPEQYNVLRIVRGQSPKSVCAKDISNRMLDRNSNTTRIIDRLELKGLLQRIASERDRREKSIQLTPKGAEMLAALDATWEKNSPHTNSNLSEAEAQTINQLLDKLRE